MPDNAGIKRVLWVTQEKIGEALLAGGEREQALDAFDKALQAARTLAAGEFATAASRRDLAISLGNLGTAQRAARNFVGALARPKPRLRSIARSRRSTREARSPAATSPWR